MSEMRRRGREFKEEGGDRAAWWWGHGPTSSPSASSISWCVLCLEHDSMNASLDALLVGKLAGVLDDSVCMNNRGWMVVESEIWK
jgi:hypothetical protein